MAIKNGQVSFWNADLGRTEPLRKPLPGNLLADVCVVGAGYTGLWSAYYLLRDNPGLRVVVLERRFAGYGASGRNGGWLAGTFDWSRERYLRHSSRAAVIAMQQALTDSVAEVIAVAGHEGIEADIRPTACLTVALNGAQRRRIEQNHDYMRSWEVPAGQISVLDGDATRQRVNAPAAQGGLLMTGMARVQPARLVHGLAAAVERLGGQIYEQTEVQDIQPGCVRTPLGEVKAKVVIRATEAYSARLPGHARTMLPLNSALIATEPLPQALWDEIGWSGYELLEDAAHAMSFAQRTADGRIAIGGRGVPYRWRSGLDEDGRTQPATIAQLRGLLARLLPQAAHVPIAHAWCGVLGVPRDWCARCCFDPASGMAWAGGYVGLGVATSNLAGRTLCDLINGRTSALTQLPWVNLPLRRWEPEPLRWLGVHATHQLYTAADRREAAGVPQTSLYARFGHWMAGI